MTVRDHDDFDLRFCIECRERGIDAVASPIRADLKQPGTPYPFHYFSLRGCLACRVRLIECARVGLVRHGNPLFTEFSLGVGDLLLCIGILNLHGGKKWQS